MHCENQITPNKQISTPNETNMIETATVNLKDFFDAILDNAADGAEVGAICRDDYDSATNSIYFENDDFMVEGSFSASGYYHETGDGYWTPRETYVTGVSVSVDELTVYQYNPETEDFDIEVDDKVVNELSAYLEKHLPGYLED